MLPLQYARRWQAASLMLLLLVLIATLMPAALFWSDRQSFLAWFEHTDKWLHGITFTVLAVWFAGQYRPRSYWLIGIGLLLFGVLIEACQRLVTYRSADPFDIAADIAGIIVGLIIATAGMGGWSQRVEAWLIHRNAVDGGD